MSSFFHAHLHSHFSTLDGMSDVKSLVDKAVLLGQPAIALTDHGNMSGTVVLYKEAMKAGIKPFPGLEGYLIDPKVDNWEKPERGQKVGRYHFGLLALDEDGYKALVKFSSMTHTRPRFNRFPRATLSDLAELGQESGEHLALMTGCFFGLVQQTLVREGEKQARRVVKMLSSWFPHTFVEVQNHNIFHTEDAGVLPEFQEDDDIVAALHRIAQALELPIIATQDAHYCDQRQKKAHALMKRMTYGGADDEFPGDSFHMASGEWVQEHYDPEVWEDIEAGYETLLRLNKVRITPLDKFKPDVPKITKNPRKKLDKLADASLEEYLDVMEVSTRDAFAYKSRLDYELDVINTIGMAEYFLIVRDYVEWCEDEGILVEARGSANGSFLCFLLGITQVDPIIENIDFDRFLSKDRIKPPDIDMDIEDEARQRLLHYLLSKYDAVQIGTFGKLGLRYDEREDKETGSVLVSWLSSKRRECEAIAARKIEERGGKKGDIQRYAQGVFNKMYGDIKDIRDVRKVSQKDYEALREISAMNSAYRSYGVHAGGVLLGGEHIKISDYIPTMLVASSDTRVSQYDMDDVEEFGLLKMDILGQATLRVMRTAIDLIGETGMDWIPNDDKEACKILRSGRTDTGVFHQEGYTKSKGGRELGVRTTRDAILVQALYMPGAMESGQTAHYIRARKDREYRRSVEYVHPIFEKHLKETYGAYVYQNQVMSILRDMGMDIPSINVFLKVVKDSGAGARERNHERLVKLKQHFDRLWEDHKIDPQHREETWDALCGFGAYGFNKAHAAGYGIRMYRCAYLKAHYPLEFMTGLLQTWAGRKKETVYIREARRMRIRLMPPHVNVSGASWSIDTKRRAIRKGLLSVPGIGSATAESIAAEAPYTSVEDMVERLPGRVMTGGKRFVEEGVLTGTVAKLNDVGALEGLSGL